MTLSWRSDPWNWSIYCCLLKNRLPTVVAVKAGGRDVVSACSAPSFWEPRWSLLIPTISEGEQTCQEAMLVLQWPRVALRYRQSSWCLNVLHKSVHGNKEAEHLSVNDVAFLCSDQRPWKCRTHYQLGLATALPHGKATLWTLQRRETKAHKHKGTYLRSYVKALRR